MVHSHSDHDHSEHDHKHQHGPAIFHSHSAHLAGAAPRILVQTIFITLAFMALELVGGWIANSLALISDGVHMLTDVGAMLLSLFAIWVSRRPRTPTMSFGYHRAEILGALASGLLIWLLAGLLVFEAVNRLQNPPDVQGPIVFAIALIGLGANLVSMKMLQSATHENMNVRAAYLHMLSDALGSVGAVVAGLVLWLTGWRAIDPIVTILFAVLMLGSSWGLVREAVGVLMESTPTGMDPKRVEQDLRSVPQVRDVHDLHIWTVASGRLALSVHLISSASEPDQVLTEVNRILKEHHGIIHTTIQIEHPERFASERCYDCAVPLAGASKKC